MVNGKIIGEEKGLEVEDAFIAGAFLVLGLEVTAFLKTPSKVIFKVKGNIDQATENIQNNIPVPLLDFISGIKRLRSQIFFLKMSPSSMEKVG